MAKIKKLEDLNAWKESIELLKIVYSILKKIPYDEKYNIKKHLMQCARNVPGNIAEGFGRYYAGDSIQFYHIALGSLNELKSDIYSAKALNYIRREDKSKIIKQADICISIIYGLIKSSKRIKEKA